MKSYIQFADHLSTWVGKGFAWCIVVLCFGTVYEVTMAYVFNAPTLWNFDFSLQMYGALFILSLIHISEPTRQEAISYAVFCLKKKKKK